MAIRQRENSSLATPKVADGRSTGEVARAVAVDTATLIRKEIELARHEMVEAAAARAKGAVAGLVAGVAALLATVFAGLAGMEALDEVMPAWAASLVVMGVFGLVALVAGLMAVRWMTTPSLAPEATQRTIRENVEWARTQLRR